MNSSNKVQCKGFRRQAEMYNAQRQGFARNYFPNLGVSAGNCPDPATALSYWRRRFATTNCYLGQYFMPHQYNKNNFGTNQWYIQNKNFSTGKVCHLLHRNNCKDTNTCKDAKMIR